MVRLTTDYIVRCNGHTKRKRDEPTNHYLKRITHLYMAERNIEAIENLSLCRNLTVLYLYDNKLKKTMNLGTAQNLTHLYLQNNNISKIEGLKHLQRLTKLYLGYNNLSVIEGLHSLEFLRELNVECQRLPQGEKLLFEPRTLYALGFCLEVLNISGNNIETLEDLIPFRRIQHVQASDNLIQDFNGLKMALMSWQHLQRIDLVGNPVCSKHKYRDQVVVLSPTLGNLDGRDISRLERQFLISWKMSRETRRRQRSEPNGIHENGNDLPPLATNGQDPSPPPHYMLKGLPGGRKRFEQILAKSRSLPNSAMPSLGGKGVHPGRYRVPYTTPGPAAPVNSTMMDEIMQQQPQKPVPMPPKMGPKSMSDLTHVNKKLERQMTPHPNTIRQRNALLAEHRTSPSVPLSSPRHPHHQNGDVLAAGETKENNEKNNNNFMYAAANQQNDRTRNYYPSLRGQKRPPPTKSLLNGALLPEPGRLNHSNNLLTNTPRNNLSGDAASNGDRNGIAIDNNLVLMSSNGMTNGHAIPGS